MKKICDLFGCVKPEMEIKNCGFCSGLMIKDFVTIHSIETIENKESPHFVLLHSE